MIKDFDHVKIIKVDNALCTSYPHTNISMDFNYCTDQIVSIHRAGTAEKNGSKWNNISAIYRLQDSLRHRREVLFNTH